MEPQSIAGLCRRKKSGTSIKQWSDLARQHLGTLATVVWKKTSTLHDLDHIEWPVSAAFRPEQPAKYALDLQSHHQQPEAPAKST